METKPEFNNVINPSSVSKTKSVKKQPILIIEDDDKKSFIDKYSRKKNNYIKMALVLVDTKTPENQSIHLICDNIYLGNKWAREYVQKNNIKRVIEIGEKDEIDEYLKIDCDKLTLFLKDSRHSDIESYFKKAWDYIDSCNTPLLIHCKVGTSRSPAILISYLISRKGYSLNSALETIKKIRKENIYTHPNTGFLKALKRLEKDCSQE